MFGDLFALTDKPVSYCGDGGVHVPPYLTESLLNVGFPGSCNRRLGRNCKRNEKEKQAAMGAPKPEAPKHPFRDQWVTFSVR